MGDDVESATFEILKGIRASLADLRAETVVMMRATAGDLDARVGEVEERVAALESRTGRGSSAERMPCAASEIDREQGTRQSDTIQLS
ncbi:hypothetical protein R1A27_23285 [Methylobacterium sp. NMS12]|uniref:hypothetical protein n=1 Tax=Methylobacterium sp. NMS12 TaxID=3079766 RepID=UPI003F88261C